MRMSESLPATLKSIIGEKRKKQLQYGRLRAMQALGRPPFTGLDGLDKRLIGHMGEKRNGFFIEAGGNDGFTQSNTFYLEKVLGWRGLLIEPIHELAAFARKVRSCDVCECALGSPDMAGEEVVLSFSDLTSTVGASGSVRWNGIFGPNPTSARSTIRTLSSIIAEQGVSQIDLLSLDVEGFEMSVLAGLNLDDHAPQYVLVETHKVEEVKSFFAAKYECLGNIGYHDYFFKKRVG